MAGRPKKPEGGARKNVLRIRLTTEERATLDAAAQARGLDVSAWARSELLTLARKTVKTKESL
jgi:hypothetical protein